MRFPSETEGIRPFKVPKLMDLAVYGSGAGHEVWCAFHLRVSAGPLSPWGHPDEGWALPTVSAWAEPVSCPTGELRAQRGRGQAGAMAGSAWGGEGRWGMICVFPKQGRSCVSARAAGRLKKRCEVCKVDMDSK